jgi:chromosome segregation ATPase
MRKLLLLLSFVYIVIVSAAQVRQTQPASPKINTIRANQAPGTTASDSVITDINTLFDQMAKAIEVEFNKLIKDAKDSKSKLEDQIKQIDNQVSKLKLQISRLNKIAEKIQELLPQFTERLDSFKRTSNALLMGEKNVALQKSIDSLQNERAAIPVKINDINNQVFSLLTQKKTMQDEIVALDKLADKLQKDKQAALLDLEKQRQLCLSRAENYKNKALLQQISNEQSRVLQDSIRINRQRIKAIQ